MEQTQATPKAHPAALPQEFASAVNLLAHPAAGAAAVGALGLGMAGHVLGLWMGTVVGAAEVSQKLFAAGAAQPQQPRRGAALRLVASRPAAKKAAATPQAEPVQASTAAPAASARPAGIERPAAPDDLKAISGIGPKLEKVLNELGIWSYRQVAALAEAEIAWLDDRLGVSGRIGRDDWVGQARALTRTLTGKAKG